jgi:hypothetical protein
MALLFDKDGKLAGVGFQRNEGPKRPRSIMFRGIPPMFHTMDPEDTLEDLTTETTSSEPTAETTKKSPRSSINPPKKKKAEQAKEGNTDNGASK